MARRNGWKRYGELNEDLRRQVAAQMPDTPVNVLEQLAYWINQNGTNVFCWRGALYVTDWNARRLF